MSDIASRNFKSRISGLTSNLPILIELIVLQFLLSVIVYSALRDSFTLTAFFILVIIESILFLLFLIYKRDKELGKVVTLIKRITNKEISDQSEIKLPQSLINLETEIKLMHKQNREDIDYLKKLERMRSEFLANVSHELRTPIFAIQGYLETLLNGALNDYEVNTSFLEKANTHTQNLSNLLSDLIDISMIETGEMRLSFRYFEINELLDSLTSEYDQIAQSKNLKLIFSPCQKNIKLYGDKNKLRQAVGNLIQNAIKYTENGFVEVSVVEEKNFGRISVRDTGIGLSEEDLTRIFERFYRVDKARSRDIGGTGLGLAIVKHIIEAHASQVKVTSQLGVGSEFSFHLKK
ncbi:MAG TPA: ATP-binding protein [Ignavibacteriaceae bacterium]|nr:ATP-binding protein [Ignavibacteriaceae bacterium]